MAKRGASGLSLVVALDKPSGYTSHDLVNIVRRRFDERRVGHTGTLDPLASGVMLVCVGPATRLDAYLSEHDKVYTMGVRFGTATSTDDSEGEVVRSAPVPDELFDESYAREQVEGLVGDGMQVPPVYSAIKIDGKKSYEAARKGNVLEIEPRPFTVHSAQFDGLETVTEDDQRYPIWHMTLHVSKGTYLRSIARDLGRNLGTAAHCAALRRVAVGNLGIDECLSLEEFDKNPMDALVDPLRLLRLRWSFLRDQDKALACGQPIGEEHVRLNEPVEGDMFDAGCCTSSVYPSCGPAQPGEVVGFVVGHELKALYEYDESKHRYKPRCVFPQGVERGTGL